MAPATSQVDPGLRVLYGYMERGWSPIPLHGKKAALLSWQRWQNNQPSPAEVRNWQNGKGLSAAGRKWHRDTGDVNWAVITGQHAATIAFDVDSQEGWDTLLEMLDGEEPTTLTNYSSTVDGFRKRHLIYRYPTEANLERIGPMVTIDGIPGLDLRADGAYIAVAPSVHVLGDKYSWSDGQIESVPPPLLDLLRKVLRKSAEDDKARKDAAEEAERDQPTLLDKGRLSRATEETLKGEVAEGTRNARLFSAACDMMGCRFPKADILDRCMTAAASMGLPTGEARTTVESALSETRAPANPGAFYTAKDRLKATMGNGDSTSVAAEAYFPSKTQAQKDYEKQQRVLPEETGEAKSIADELAEEEKTTAPPAPPKPPRPAPPAPPPDKEMPKVEGPFSPDTVTVPPVGEHPGDVSDSLEAPTTNPDLVGITEIERYPCTDMGNAELLTMLMGAHLLFNHQKKIWLVWNGHYWEPDPKAVVIKIVGTVARDRLNLAKDIEDAEERGRQCKWARGSENLGKMNAALEVAKSLPPVAQTGLEFDRNSLQSVFRNGVVNLVDGSIRPGERAEMSTKLIPFRYEPEADAPRWTQFMLEIFQGDEELVRWIQRASGYSMTGSVSEQCLFICHGDGGNGKSVFLNVLNRLLGTYGITTPFSTFESVEGAGRASPELARMDGKRFVAAREVKESRKMDEGKIKSLTGGDPIACRALYQDMYEYVPQYKIWVAVNHLPTVTDISEGMWRRIQTVPFDATFTSKPDKNLEPTLMEEAEGILAWLVRGAMDWYENGLGTAAAVTRATEDYRAGSDYIAELLEDKCAIGGDIKRGAKASDLFATYKEWCFDNNTSPVTNKIFREGMMRKHFTQDRFNDGNVWKEVRIIGAQDPVKRKFDAYKKRQG